jgi:hypothetical protein
MLRATERAISDDQRVGFIGTSKDWDYPLFGPHFERHVVRLPELDERSDALLAVRVFDLDSIVWAIEPPRGVRARLLNAGSGEREQDTNRWLQEGSPTFTRRSSTSPTPRIRARPAG